MAETVRIPLAVDLDIQAFSGGGITDYDGTINGFINEDNGEFKVTERPSIDIFELASDSNDSLEDKARGIFYWEEDARLFMVNNDSMYHTSQNSGNKILTVNPTAGTEKLTILEATGTGVGVLIVLDAENNNAIQVALKSGGDNTGSAFSPTNFPSTLVHGGAVLDTYLFVMDENGIIYNSAVGNVDIFPVAGLLTAERELDKGCYLGKHHDNLVAFGTRTTEFFYDAGNTIGSPLNRRTDIFYNTGCVDGLSVWENEDITYFLGSDSSGSLGVYKLENFILTKISKNGLDSYLTHNITQDTFKIVGSGFTAGGHTIYILTTYTLSGGEILPDTTIVYDNTVGMWSIWKTSANNHTAFPLVGWTKRTGGFNATTGARAGEGILHNGDLITLSDNIIPLDTVKGLTGYFTGGDYFTDPYFTVASPDVSSNINLNIRTSMWSGGTNKLKTQHSIRPIMDETSSSQTLTLKWTKRDEQRNSFTTGRSLDTSKRQFARRGGIFTKRGYQVDYSGTEQIWLESLEGEFTMGNA